ncbi:hypothetical protein [Pandoraea sp. SD6-2]|uniref:hypothetical protein n=1 Tax=Pandoraea sp. SD6-2 TaxID=1286093 RepID=UPI00032DBDB2|nr:hypothetical protein [Pandoraea sp. SD6-2]EON12885.1 hypothetical protein C266_14717 [Pandoraea sp. SD6-2]
MVNVTSVAGFDQICKNFTHLFFCIRFDEKRENLSRLHELQQVRLDAHFNQCGVNRDEPVRSGGHDVIVVSLGNSTVEAVASLPGRGELFAFFCERKLSPMTPRIEAELKAVYWA